MRNKYKSRGEDPFNKSAFQLLEHFESEVDKSLSPIRWKGKEITLLHWFREMRNKIHTDELIEEQDVLIGIRYMTQGINELYPYDTGEITWDCNCGTQYTTRHKSEKFHIGNPITTRCNSCNKTNTHHIGSDSLKLLSIA